MKHLPITNPRYQKTLVSFKDWLSTMGYSEQTCKGLPGTLREYLHFLENEGVLHFTDITNDHNKSYIRYLKTKKHISGEGAISAASINNHITVLSRFSSYIRQSAGIQLPPPPEYLRSDTKPQPVILTTDEIKSLYQTADENLTGLRDKAMLTVYYGCGLRKKEGVQLDVSDILFERKLLNVGKAKNTYQRYVPLTAAGVKYLENYITRARPLLLADGSKEPALFVNHKGQRLCHTTMYNRLVWLYKKAGITKKAGIHTLRHSIATHLLQQGMELEQIALFLGHRCLDSTQIYTHIVNHPGDQNN